jgi:glycosyltransferase involved in cell wall biosynthesis
MRAATRHVRMSLIHLRLESDHMGDRLKILFLTQHWPMAPTYGAQQRVLNTARLLSRFGRVSFVIVSIESEDKETERRTRDEFEVCRIMHPVQRRRGDLFQRLQHRLRCDLDPSYLATDQWGITDADRNTLLELIQKHDIIWIRSVTTANWCRIDRWPHSVLDADDLYSRLNLLSARNGRNLTKRLVDLRRSLIWLRREMFVISRFDVVTVCSDDDRRYLGGDERIHVIPNGFDPLPSPRRGSSIPTLGFIGLFKYSPNVEGVRWFISDVWPLIKSELPCAQLRLVGRGSETFVTSNDAGVTGLGWMEDPTEEIALWSAMIVPINVGGGTRIKIVDGFARKCPVVSTTVGAFGYDVHDGEELLIADRAEDFASACVRLLRDPQFGEALSARAYRRFLQQWTWGSFEGSVGTVIHKCLAMSGR